MAELYTILQDIKADLMEARRPKQRKNRAPWRERLPDLEAIVIEKGYARATDAEKLGINNTDWTRCIAELILKHPDWHTDTVKHRKILYLSDFDINQVELEVITYENYLSNDSKVLRHMVEKITRMGRLNVLNDLQTHQPLTTAEWRNKFLENLEEYVKERNLPIEVEIIENMNWATKILYKNKTGWFRKKG